MEYFERFDGFTYCSVDAEGVQDVDGWDAPHIRLDNLVLA